MSTKRPVPEILSGAIQGFTEFYGGRGRGMMLAIQTNEVVNLTRAQARALADELVAWIINMPLDTEADGLALQACWQEPDNKLLGFRPESIRLSTRANKKLNETAESNKTDEAECVGNSCPIPERKR